MKGSILEKNENWCLESQKKFVGKGADSAYQICLHFKQCFQKASSSKLLQFAIA